MSNIYKKIYKVIKKYDHIVIARHIGADPDALGSQLALKELILNKFPNKDVKVIGNPANRFKFMGEMDKIDEVLDNTLLIALDTPDVKRLDGVDFSKYNYVIKIDHHPFVEEYANIEMLDDSACSVCQIILKLVFSTPFKLTKSIGEKLYLGIVSDTGRFLHEYTTLETFELVSKLIRKTKIDFTSLYPSLYLRPLNEVKFQGYIYQNMSITDNGVAYIKITDDLMKEFNVDSASAGNMINDLNYVNEILVWVFFSEDLKTNLIRANIRSRGPFINEIASRFGGGGHKYASGARLTSWQQTKSLVDALDEKALEYKENLNKIEE